MATQQFNNKSLVFAITDSDFGEIESAVQRGLNWTRDPVIKRKAVKEVELSIQRGGALPCEGVFY